MDAAVVAQKFTKTPKQADQVRLIGGDAQHILGYGGSRSGKTFGFTRAVIIRACLAPGSRHVIWRYRLNHLMASIWADTFPKVMRLCFPNVPYTTNKVDGYITLSNGSEIWVGGLDDKDRVEKILGMEFSTIYANEISQISFDAITTGMSRLAQRVIVPKTGKLLRLKAFYDCNPPGKKHWSYKQFIQKVDPETGKPLLNPENYAHIQMNPGDNLDNLAPEYIRTLEALPPRKRKRFLAGLFGEGTENALWDYEVIKHDYAPKHGGSAPVKLPDFKRIVVAVDPAISNTPGSDEHGIIVCASDFDDNGYVLADYSCKGKPDDWAAAVASAYNTYNADAVVCEVNQGGDMVESTVRTKLPRARVVQVRATRGKAVRAEPVSALYHQGKVQHVGDFEELEEQQCEFTVDFDRKAAGYSPDRLDALVWGLTELMVEPETGGHFIGHFN